MRVLLPRSLPGSVGRAALLPGSLGRGSLLRGSRRSGLVFG